MDGNAFGHFHAAIFMSGRKCSSMMGNAGVQMPTRDDVVGLLIGISVLIALNLFVRYFSVSITWR